MDDGPYPAVLDWVQELGADVEMRHSRVVISYQESAEPVVAHDTYTLEETLDALEELLARRCAPDPFYTARVDAAFTYRDHDNCHRAVRAVDRLLRESAVNP